MMLSFSLVSAGSTLLGGLNAIAIVVAIGLIGLVVLVSLGRHFSLMRRGWMPDEHLEWRRDDLLLKVGEATHQYGMPVALRSYWRGAEVTSAQRYVVLHGLFRRRILTPVYSTEKLIEFFQVLSWNVLRMPAGYVRLSEKQWHKLIAPRSIIADNGSTVVAESHNTSVTAHSPGAFTTATAMTVLPQLTPALIEALVDALRHEAQTFAPGSLPRERAESYADTLERDAAANRWESIKTTTSEVVEFASNLAGLFASTLSVLGFR